MDAATRIDDSSLSYPPYNIERTGDDTYRITMAVAGFGESDLTITTQDNQLLISGKNAKDKDKQSYLYRGIAGRAFERRFTLADHIRVNGASLVNGLLHVDLVREVPEAMKPRQVKIGASKASRRCLRARRPSKGLPAIAQTSSDLRCSYWPGASPASSFCVRKSSSQKEKPEGRCTSRWRPSRFQASACLTCPWRLR